MKNTTEYVLNKLLVQLFNDILQIEKNAMNNTEFKDLSITEIHTIEAIGKEGKDRKSTRLNSSHSDRSRMPSSA